MLTEGSVLEVCCQEKGGEQAEGILCISLVPPPAGVVPLQGGDCRSPASPLFPVMPRSVSGSLMKSGIVDYFGHGGRDFPRRSTRK